MQKRNILVGLRPDQLLKARFSSMNTSQADESSERRQNSNKNVASSQSRRYEDQPDFTHASRRSRRSIEDLEHRRTGQRNLGWREQRRSHSPARRKPRENMMGRYQPRDRSNSPRQRERRPKAEEPDNKDRKRSERREDRNVGLPSTLSIDRHMGQVPLPTQQDMFRMSEADNGELEPVEKQRPNYEASGKLAAETNLISGTDIVLKYNEPSEARKDSKPWRLYIFKGQETLDQLELYRRSCWLFGREKVVVDYELTHPSCSKQHAVIQFRHLEKRNGYGDRIGIIKPYVIDLESANGTRVNGEQVPDRRFIELRSGDVLTFGHSSRDYVIILPP